MKAQNKMSSIPRCEITKGLRVRIVLKNDQRTGKLTEGIVKEILTKSATHPHGIKVRLEDGQVGRVKKLMGHNNALSYGLVVFNPTKVPPFF